MTLWLSWMVHFPKECVCAKTANFWKLSNEELASLAVRYSHRIRDWQEMITTFTLWSKRCILMVRHTPRPSNRHDKRIPVGLYARNLLGVHKTPNKNMAQGWNEQQCTHRINSSADRWQDAVGYVSLHPVWVPKKIYVVVWSWFVENFRVSPVSSIPRANCTQRHNSKQYFWHFWNPQRSHASCEAKK